MSSSFTITYGKVTRVLLSEITIALPTVEKDFDKITKFGCIGIWDTGATSSAITKKVATQLGLIPTGMAMVNTANGIVPQNTYTINIYLPNKTPVTFVQVTECEALTQNPDENVEVLIGMDVISKGDFVISNNKNQTVFNFRIPSVLQTNFVDEFNRARAKGIGRNDKCFCGSNLKYKHCHGKPGA